MVLCETLNRHTKSARVAVPSARASARPAFDAQLVLTVTPSGRHKSRPFRRFGVPAMALAIRPIVERRQRAP
jgi:hypothetical protein